MLYTVKVWILIILGSFSINIAAQVETDSIEVQLVFDDPCQGQILLSCFQSDVGFMDYKQAFYSDVLTCQNALMIEGLDNTLPRAVMAYVDLNRNEKLDLNFFGIPTEPYAISNGFRGKWREPKFKDAAESSTSKKIVLEFKYWKNR